ncbi:formin-like protein 3 [Xyrichtys novacula]|uniref:Formin-like protein 3 n=1 Tax=Xyrichtys novacula TaxID=13765 RepID=A0AAV1F2J9_XYRNO|nr:formin-like protein 3 [Xyrichtys novacula]
MMSRQQLPHIGSSRRKTTAKPPLPSPALRRPHQANSRKRSQPQMSLSSSHPNTGPTSVPLSDTTMTPWGGLALSESSLTLIPPPPRPIPPPPPPAPQPTPSTPYQGRESEDDSSSSFKSEVPSSPAVIPKDHPDGEGRGLRSRRRVLPQRPQRVPRPPRLPPLRPITNLSFSRSFTFSFFELPLHQSPRHRAERIRNLMLLLRQIHL